MRHRKRGRHLGRSSSHRKAMLRNLASSLFLTERDAELDSNAPQVKGRITTTLAKAKEVRPLVEKCITIARNSLSHEDAARQYTPGAERGSEAWRSWRQSDRWQRWNAAIAPAVAARRRVLQLLGDKQAVRVLFDEVAPRFTERPGGYTRILKLAAPRLGDAGPRAIIEFVGERDRVPQSAERPAFDQEDDDADSAGQTPAPDHADVEQPAADASALPADVPQDEPTAGSDAEPPSDK